MCKNKTKNELEENKGSKQKKKKKNQISRFNKHVYLMTKTKDFCDVGTFISLFWKITNKFL